MNTNIKSEYGTGETMIIKVGGNIAQTIEAEQVTFKKNNIFVPLEYDVARVGNSWYIWAIAPDKKGNYTFSINDVSVINNGGTLQKESYQSNFEVSNNVTGYNVKPGFIITDKSFFVEANVMDDNSKDISAGFNGEQVVILEPGVNRIDFSISKITNTGLYTLQVGKYFIPVYVTIPGSVPIAEGTMQNMSNKTETNSTNQTMNVTNSSNVVYATQYNLEIEPSYIQRLIYSDAQSSTYSFTLRNPSNVTYKNVKINFNESLFEITPEDTVTLKANENYSFNLTLGKFNGEEVREQIYVNATNFSLEIPLFVRYTENVSDVSAFYGEVVGNKTNSTRKTTYMCSELGGVVCSSNTMCKGESLTSKEGNCCLGVCTQSDSGSSKAWIGWIIAFAALGAMWWLYLKYKDAGTKKVSVSDIAQAVTPPSHPPVDLGLDHLSGKDGPSDVKLP
ncbi:MAG TPA: hypothetical protein VHA12_02180 [Candidatus Nanoarchaeia archaeon]|nr:hypothetical protein [Candidatus Nanoarchaeia archaeon]